jgi:hypothetical protein
MTYTYFLIDGKDWEDEKPAPQLKELRGLLKDSLQSLGGGEAFLRHERNQFHSERAAEDE